MQFDQSTTTVALGKITMAKAAGKSKEAAVFRRYINANKKGKK